MKSLLQCCAKDAEFQVEKYKENTVWKQNVFLIKDGKDNIPMIRTLFFYENPVLTFFLSLFCAQSVQLFDEHLFSPKH